MQQKLIAMRKWLCANGLNAPPVLPQTLLLNSCTADNPGMAVIQADGGLNCCDHIGESKPYGSVFEEGANDSVIRWWAERKAAIPECDGCALYPQCLRLTHCAAKKGVCTEIVRQDRQSVIAIAMENAYIHGTAT